ncbi:MAG TPA: peptidoglycan-binding protein, partial [Solirubrobacteraceae bacterium]|nr:peptidoglycan-binding protein [Solirubrobacteraceae bacterium]
QQPGGTASLSDAAALQVALRARGLYAGAVDGIAGPATSAAVRTLQRRAGLVVDGVAGPATRRALGWRGRPPLGARAVSAGMRGWDVAAVQFLLARAGFPSGPFDGRAGPRFAAALVRFQTWAALAVDGVAGPATIARLGRPPPRSPLALRAPVAAVATDGFGSRGGAFHTGIDFPAATGTPVTAAAAGCVTFAGVDDGYGRLVIVGHALGVTTWYAHLSRIDVRPGACVVGGARLGAVGATGVATGPHLHFEVRVRGAATDPRFALR